MNATKMKPRWGTYILADLSQYLGKFRGHIGKFKGRKWYGQDTKTGRDGSVYDGNFKDGVFHGHGTYTFGKGEFEGHKCIGEFKDGAAWNATDYDPNGEVIATWVEGARQRVVIM